MKLTTFMEKTDRLLTKIKPIIMYGNTKVAYFMIGAMTMITIDYFSRSDWFNVVLGIVIVSVFYITEREANVQKAQ